MFRNRFKIHSFRMLLTEQFLIANVKEITSCQILSEILLNTSRAISKFTLK